MDANASRNPLHATEINHRQINFGGGMALKRQASISNTMPYHHQSLG